MMARGFPNKWVSWIMTIWSSSSSQVCVNGATSTPFFHQRGLHQGDPLSPMLFDIAADVFQQMIRVANSLLPMWLSTRISASLFALQYADDTAVIARADLVTLITFKLTLRVFSAISGLQVNYQKSSFVPINIAQDQISMVKAVIVIGFTQTEFPVIYLGMPLTLTKPGRSLFISLIEKIEKRLEGWQSRLISRGERLQLVQSVLSTVPIYYMHCFLLPKWVIRRIDKAR